MDFSVPACTVFIPVSCQWIELYRGVFCATVYTVYWQPQYIEYWRCQPYICGLVSQRVLNVHEVVLCHRVLNVIVQLSVSETVYQQWIKLYGEKCRMFAICFSFDLICGPCAVLDVAVEQLYRVVFCDTVYSLHCSFHLSYILRNSFLAVNRIILWNFLCQCVHC